MCATAALHPDEVRAWIGYTARHTSDTEGPAALEPHDDRPPSPRYGSRPADRGHLLLSEHGAGAEQTVENAGLLDLGTVAIDLLRRRFAVLLALGVDDPRVVEPPGSGPFGSAPPRRHGGNPMLAA